MGITAYEEAIFMNEINKSRTYENVIKEIESRGKNMALLRVFSDRAKAQGYFTVAHKLDEVTKQESEHCAVLYRIMQEGDEIDTLANLIYCAGQLNASSARLRTQFVATAKEEGFDYIAGVIDEIAKVDTQTEMQLKEIMEELRVGKLYVGDKSTAWQCIKCGCSVENSNAPDICPLCASQKGFFAKIKK